TNMEQLAGETFHGRACGTADENAAAKYVAATLKAARIAPGLPHAQYLQPVRLETPLYAVPPTVTLFSGAVSVTMTLGQEMVSRDLPAALTAPSMVLDAATAPGAA